MLYIFSDKLNYRTAISADKRQKEMDVRVYIYIIKQMNKLIL